MGTFEQRVEWRRQFLHRLYDLSEGDETEFVTAAEVARDLEGATGPDVDRVIRYLQGQGLVDFPGLAVTEGHITSMGVAKVESELLETTSAVGLVLTHEEQRDVEAVVTQLRQAIESGEISLGDGDRADLDVQLDTISTQLRSPRPRRRVIGWALAAIQWVGENSASGAVQGAAWLSLVELARRFG